MQLFQGFLFQRSLFPRVGKLCLVSAGKHSWWRCPNSRSDPSYLDMVKISISKPGNSRNVGKKPPGRESHLHTALTHSLTWLAKPHHGMWHVRLCRSQYCTPLPWSRIALAGYEARKWYSHFRAGCKLQAGLATHVTFTWTNRVAWCRPNAYVDWISLVQMTVTWKA